jgi:Secretion system C-terminal sorting domain
MKKYLLSLIALIYLAQGNAQTVQASIGAGSVANSVRVYIRPDVTNPAVSVSTMQFNIAIPASAAPVPTLSVTTNNIAGVTWIVETPYTEGGYIHYNIYNNQSSYTINCSSGIDIQVMEVTFLGGNNAPVANTAHLVTLPDGGLLGPFPGTALFYFTSAVGGVLNSNGQSLYYARDGNVVFANGDTYRPVPPGGIVQRGTFTSFARLTTPVALGAGTVPVTFTSFDAKCSDKGIFISWSTATEQNSDRFDVERSDNGVDWYKIGAVAAAGNSNANRTYQYLDLKGGSAYYRLRQVDLDGRFMTTNVKRTACKSGELDVVIYPVPAKDNLTVVIKSDKAIKTDLRIVDMAGKVVRIIPTQINSGNNTINLNVSQLASGQYILGSSDPTLQLNNKFTILR